MRVARLLLLLLVWVPLGASSQTVCKDSTRVPDTYAPCGVLLGFNPVCACDNKLYRNDCAAYYWGGTEYNNPPVASDNCPSFFIEMFPTAVTYMDAKFNLFMKRQGSATIYLIYMFGRARFQRSLPTLYEGQKLENEPLPTQSLQMGVYTLITIANGEKQVIKFAKAVEPE